MTTVSLTDREVQIFWVCFSAYRWNNLSEMPITDVQLLPEVRHSWLVQEISEDVVTTALETGMKQLCPRANAVTSDGVAQASAAGLSVRAWGVKDVSVRPLLHS